MAKKKWMKLLATITGEMKAEDIPPAPGVDIAAIKHGDDDPMEIVVGIPAGKSTRGWNYRPESLKSIVDYVNQYTLNGILGHQKPEDVATEFVDPVTHWIGAKMVGETAFFRGIIDKDAPKLKRWVRTKRIKQVSIFGYPMLETVDGETHVVDFEPLSIDWTPLDRSGMPTRIVSIGEMDDPNDEGGKTMDWKELLAQLKNKIADGTVTLRDVISGLDPEGSQKNAAAFTLLEKIKTTLGVSEDADLLPKIEEAGKALGAVRQQEQQKQVQDVVKEKVAGEMAQGIIMKMIPVREGMTKETIVGEIDSLLADENVKAMISRIHTDRPPYVGSGKNNNSDTESDTVWASI
ncbi:transcriptional regulator [Paenibacillus sp. MSJ-34]|uniref:transcriptional regulator n=1 Tax=Paenibacillus sp. MSJ-34 TaxID=2841529 RepID=UPI0020A0601D|nr:transcriptional regulator [Paenibacillus sp. MSJ-34]